MKLVNVELDVFSGRPNPRWELTRATGIQLHALLNELPYSATKLPHPTSLGYRGFIVTSQNHSYRVFQGVVEVDGETFNDPGRRVEKLLLNSMPDSLKGNVHEND